MINNKWDWLKKQLKCVSGQILICMWSVWLLPCLWLHEKTGEEQRSGWENGEACGCDRAPTMARAEAHSCSLSEVEHKGPLIECHCATDTLDLPAPPKHSHTIISKRPHNFIPTPPGHHTAVSSSHLQRHRSCGEHRLLTTHHISGCLIQFCKGNECKASCAVGWDVLLSWWELSNVIKIQAGALHIQPVELTGRSASKQSLPSLCFMLTGRGAMQGGRSEDMCLQSVCPV